MGQPIGVTSHRQPRRAQNGEGGQKWPELHVCIKTVIRLRIPVFHKIITLPTYFTVPDRTLFIIPVANVCRGPKNNNYATGSTQPTDNSDLDWPVYIANGRHFQDWWTQRFTS